MIHKSGDTIKRWLSPKEISLAIAVKIAQKMFKNNRELTLSVDDSLLHKIHSMLMVEREILRYQTGETGHGISPYCWCTY